MLAVLREGSCPPECPRVNLPRDLGCDSRISINCSVTCLVNNVYCKYIPNITQDILALKRLLFI